MKLYFFLNISQGDQLFDISKLFNISLINNKFPFFGMQNSEF